MKQLLLYILFIPIFLSCEKDKDDPIPDPTPIYFTFNGEIGVNDNSTITTLDNNLLICGNTGSNICILKITKAGSQIWRKEFKAGSGSSASGIAQISSDEVFICGTTYRNELSSKSDILLIKTNSMGDTLWTKTFGGSQDDHGYYSIASQDGSLIICGTTESFTKQGFNGIYLVKLNANGDTIWTKTHFELSPVRPFHIMETENGELLITGTINDSDSTTALYRVKFTSTGAPVWNKIIGPALSQGGFSTVEMANGDLMTCGRIREDDQDQILLLKTDGLGSTYWHKQYGDVFYSERGNAIEVNEDGSFIITGTSFQAQSGQSEIILLKVDANGNQLFLKRLDGQLVNYGQNIIKDDNDDNIITGQHSGTIVMTKTDNTGVFK